MEMFCQACDFMNRHYGENNNTMFECDGTFETRQGSDCYICPNGHEIPKGVYDLLPTKQWVANVKMACGCADSVEMAYEL